MPSSGNQITLYIRFGLSGNFRTRGISAGRGNLDPGGWKKKLSRSTGINALGSKAASPAEALKRSLRK